MSFAQILAYSKRILIIKRLHYFNYLLILLLGIVSIYQTFSDVKKDGEGIIYFIIDTNGASIFTCYIIYSSIASEIRKDRQTKMKNLLRIEGFNWKSYYLSYVLVEFSIGLLITIIICGFGIVYKGYNTQQTLGCFISTIEIGRAHV